MSFFSQAQIHVIANGYANFLNVSKIMVSTQKSFRIFIGIVNLK